MSARTSVLVARRTKLPPTRRELSLLNLFPFLSRMASSILAAYRDSSRQAIRV